MRPAAKDYFLKKSSKTSETHALLLLKKSYFFIATGDTSRRFWRTYSVTLSILLPFSTILMARLILKITLPVMTSVSIRIASAKKWCSGIAGVLLSRIYSIDLSITVGVLVEFNFIQKI